ncbi:Translation initiation factor IF-2 [Spiroplasma sp. JKS002669]|uniref:translation initiation factor IF-2 n=1 Tax=Spiroplasma attinicola TaxID=2904537 RepID=UPI00202304E3|nr:MULTISPECIES: translation initiation factor IF-2 [unclassified Spiroplasma]MCL6429213.1 Translation initiation factor IF-2 [Spiroplasma sp. JKS002669]MCL8209466.1 Translation initiation factor IF-2 [Spiroplasma sp. JKS002670]MCL8210285.1 Translation initiation factor IF-2 [Spiroplasma sp. JKS002671]
MAKKQDSKQVKNISQQLKQQTAHVDEKGVFVFQEPLTIAQLANALNISIVDIIKYFMKHGKMYNQNQLLNEELMAEVCLEFGFDFKKTKNVTYENILETVEFDDKPENLLPRPPVVTIMGHVDHGKTTLLDTIRNSNVTKQEHGGITQHIGAYQVRTKEGKKITFIDTPGHEAFTEMRARGSKITDIVILVVAADDGVMPQTKEAIDHAKAANVEIIVFVNKIDKPGINKDKVLSELSNFGLTSEEWGGDTIFVYGSALKHQGIDELLEAILLVADVKELKANPNRFANGTVIESHYDKNIGSVCTLLVQGGTLNVKDIIVAGAIKGKIKKMTSDLGKDVKQATPSAVIQVLGFESAPTPGELFMVFNDEKIAKKVASARQQDEQLKKQISLGNIAQEASSGELKQINIILKADTQGSLQALIQALTKIKVKDIQVKLIRAGVGGITESDVTLAVASNSVIYGFNVRPNHIVRDAAQDAKIEIRLHNVIYKLTEELENAAKGLLAPEYEEKVLGQARVVRLFHYSKVGTIAGCLVIDGMITRNSKVRILRNDIVIYSGEINSLKHEKEDLKSVKKGFECGITVKNYNDLKEDDIIEAYIIEEVKNNG